jgi:hypothetical protein
MNIAKLPEQTVAEADSGRLKEFESQEPVTMRSLVVAFGVLGATVSTAHTQNYPWCLQSGAFDGSQHCTYTT